MNRNSHGLGVFILQEGIVIVDDSNPTAFVENVLLFVRWDL